MNSSELAGLQPIFYGVLKGGSMIDYDGHSTKVFFTAGCNCRCGFCHNSEMVHAASGKMDWDRVMRILNEARDDWIDAVCITGGEPLLHPGLLEVITFIKEQGFKVKLDTNGTLPRRLKKVINLVDYIAMDYKACLSRYHEVTQVMIKPEVINASVDLLRSLDPKSYEMRTTVLEQIHDEDCMRNIANELKGIGRYVLQPFTPQESLYNPVFMGISRTRPAFLERCRELVLPLIPGTVIRGSGL